MSIPILSRPLEWSIRLGAGRTWTGCVDLERSARVWGAIRAAAVSDGAPPALSHAVHAFAQTFSAIGAGFAMKRDDSWEPLLASSTEARALDDLQFTLGEGPSRDAVRGGAPVLESDLTGPEAGRRWPMFATAAGQRGVGSAFAFPVGVGAARVGVLTLYRSERDPLPRGALEDAFVFADAVLVLALDDRIGITTDTDRLVGAAFAAHRAEVHQATGVIAAQHGISVTDALLRLRAYAYSSGTSLSAVAAEVMAGRLRLEIDHLATGTPEPKEAGSQHAEPEQEKDS